MKIELTDRYHALGIPYPDPQTMCKGQCEGIGYYPVKENEVENVYEVKMWSREHEKTCNNIRWRIKRLFTKYWRDAFRECDGWHFIKCPDCNGTGNSSK